MTLLRIEYTKTDFLRYISHLDMVRLFERGLRRGQVPLVFSQGFNPHPRISFAAPLSVGYSSDAELVDIEIEDNWSPDQLPLIFKTCFPADVAFRRYRVLASSKSLMSMMRASDYQLCWSVPEAVCQEAVSLLDTLSARESLLTVKKIKGKKERKIDIAPMIHTVKVLEVRKATSGMLEDAAQDETEAMCEIFAFAHLDAGSESNLKPDLMIQAVGQLMENPVFAERGHLQVHRTALYGEGSKPLFDLD
jgi:radical SAM-linked protein